MSTSDNGQPVEFKVILAQKHHESLKKLHQQAINQGKGSEFVESLRRIWERLRQAPSTFGDPLYPLPTLNLYIYQCVDSPLVVHYGIHQQLPLVMIMGLKYLNPN
jgi:hypothetical protein